MNRIADTLRCVEKIQFLRPKLTWLSTLRGIELKSPICLLGERSKLGCHKICYLEKYLSLNLSSSASMIPHQFLEPKLTQALQMKRTWSQANAHEYGQLGIIESVKLRNFMCHENLSFDFDPHMNFIVGRNGSGKSAVLTGIILALGGKSGATGRFSNIKGFVKTGKNSATVSVTLKNCGPDAYKPDDYGEKVTIERQFTSDGVSSYKLKSEAGRIISTSKEELTNILNVMDIQIENPITVLTQETSRNFLVSKNSKGDKLFKLFYEGTGLSKIYDAYNRALQMSQDAKSELKTKKSILDDMENDMKTLKALLDKSSKVDELRKELLWAMVIKIERERDEAVAASVNAQKEVSGLLKQLKDNEAEINEISQNVVNVGADKRASQDKMALIRNEIKNLDCAKSQLASELRDAQGTCARLEREIKKLGDDIAGTEKIMDQIRMQNQHDRDEDRLRHERSLKNLKTEIQNVAAAIGMLDSKQFVLRENTERVQKKIDHCQTEIQELNYEKSRIEKQRQQIINGMKNRLHVFGVEMTDVLEEINAGINAGIFKKPPKGPIGLYIDVRKPEWKFAVQECLKMTLLRTFLCDNHEDGEQLSKIFSKHYQRQRPSIIISKFVSEVYDVSAHKCITVYPTVFDMLNIKDPVVANCLIDHKQIENILLVEHPTEARNLMLKNPPSKCSFVYSLNGDQFCHSPVRKYSCRNKNQICIFKSIDEGDLKEKDEEIKRVNICLAQKTESKANLLKELEMKNQEIESLNQTSSNKKYHLNQLHMKLKDEENSYSEPKDINNLHSELDNFMNEKTKKEKELVSQNEIKKSISEKFNELIRKLAEHTKSLHVESLNFEHLSKNVEEFQNRKEKLDFTTKRIKCRLGQLTPDVKEKESAVDNCNGTVKIFTERALKACPRIDTERSTETLRLLVKEMENYLEKQKNGDRESLCNEYEQKAGNINKAKVELARQEKINDRLIKMLAQRFQEFRKICKNTSVSLTCTFTTLLKENNFIGYPDVNFETKSLEIFAKPEKTKSKIGNKPNLSQLSGGERSYVTIAFLLSLWDRIHSPFRILDEYDVFMDSNNRHLSIHLLINTAKSNKKIQYIFLSPLELPHIEDSDHVKVHQMSAPRD